jgi:hypothetical protein
MGDNRRVGNDGESVIRRFYELSIAGAVLLGPVGRNAASRPPSSQSVRRSVEEIGAGDRRPMSNLDHIRSYYEALNTGDVDLVASHFTEDAVHYYTRLGPHRGREIAENAKWGVETVDGQWWMEHESSPATRR